LTPTTPKNVISKELYATLLKGGACVITSPFTLIHVAHELVKRYNKEELITLPVWLLGGSMVDITFTELRSTYIGLSFNGVIAPPDGSEMSVEIQGTLVDPSGGSFQLMMTH
jgi:hypothetical protein